MELYNDENDEYYVCCEVCDKYCIKRCYDKHIKSITHTSNLIKLQKSSK